MQVGCALHRLRLMPWVRGANETQHQDLGLRKCKCCCSCHYRTFVHRSEAYRTWAARLVHDVIHHDDGVSTARGRATRRIHASG